MVSALKDLREVVENNLKPLKKGAHAQLDQMMSACFHMDLSPLFSSDFGRVIRSFIPTDAETLGTAVESFAESGETQTERDDLLLLLKVGADIDGLHEGKSALIHAVYAGSLQAVEILVEAGADPVTKGEEERFEGYTALHCACYERRPDIVRFLVSQGANVNVKDDTDRSPLACAVYKGPREIVDFLLEKGADLHTTNECGYSLLHQAAVGNRREIAEMLLDRGLEVDVRDDFQQTPLCMTTMYFVSNFDPDYPDGIFLDNVEVAELLLDRGADPNAVAQEGFTTAIDAAEFGSVNVLKLLVDRGADLHATTPDGRNLLHFATKWPVNSDGNRAPESQCPHNNKREIAEFLVRRGIDASAQFNGMTAADYAGLEGFQADSPLRAFLDTL